MCLLRQVRKACPVSVVRLIPSAGTHRELIGGSFLWQRHVFERKKPHVNVGTIGHIDHGKTTLTAALSARSAVKFANVTAKNYKDIAKGGTERDATKTVTIAAAHVEYESDDSSLCPRGLPRPRRLHQEHDHRRRPDGRRDPGGVGR